MSAPAVVAPPPFTYHRPALLADALELMALDGAVALAGATDLVTMRAHGALAPNHVVDVKAIPALRAIEHYADGTVAIGAAASLERVAVECRTTLPAVADGALLVGAPQTRARGTVGGNVCRASPAGDTLSALLALGARARLASAAGGERVVALDAFFTGPGRSVRAPDELLTRLELPPQLGGSAYARFTYRRAMDLAVAGVAARVTLGGDGRCATATVAIGAVGPTPALVPAAAAALVGTACEADDVRAVCEEVVRAASPIDDVRGTRRHRLRVLVPLARGVVETALARARARAGEVTA
jgi:CO/xanthine dehydrogenase FAD-binding subunit